VTKLKEYIDFAGKDVFYFILLGGFVGVVLSIVEVSIGYLLQAFLLYMGFVDIDKVNLVGLLKNSNRDYVILIFIIVAFLRLLLTWIRSVMSGRLIENFRRRQRHRLSEWIFNGKNVSLSKYFYLYGDVLSFSSTFSMELQGLVINFIFFIFLLLTIFKISIKLTFITLLITFMLYIPLKLISKKVKKSSEEVMNANSEGLKSITSTLKNLILIKIYNRSEYEIKNINRMVDRFYFGRIEFFFYDGLLSSIPAFVGVLVICLISLFGFESFVSTKGDILTFFYLVIRIKQSVTACSKHYSGMSFLRPHFKEFHTWYKNDFKELVSKNNTYLSTSTIVGDNVGWKIQNLNFSYGEKKIFCNLNFEFKPNSLNLISGESGVGKSTLLFMLISQIDSNGMISLVVDNKLVDLKTIKSELLNSIGYVGPEPYIIEGSIRENLLYGIKKVSDEKIYEAINTSNSNFVYDLPKGLDHKLNERGEGLSAGQKQRLSFCRALLRTPKVLILDEPTSNLDSESEDIFIETIGKLRADKTVIIISHSQKFTTIADTHLKL
tara:strand:- start:133587 stop:135236 length:1650 start_codon:yes stop_codon:yes gene_type:complete